jgi:hypothetical protein
MKPRFAVNDCRGLLLSITAVEEVIAIATMARRA